MARLRVARIVLGLLLVSLLLVPVQLLAIRFGWSLRRELPRLWHRAAVALVGVRVVVRGEPASNRPLLLVSNHQSWADILALGSVVSCSFIAKSEVRSWPVFGWLARLQRTVFVERRRRGRVGREAGSIARRLAAGDAMVLFAEGTTSDGNRVLPFRTALFGAAQSALADSGREAVLVQPVSIAWTALHGLALGVSGRPRAAWTGDQELAPHLLAFLKAGAYDAEISFGEPVAFAAGSDRKRVASTCETAVRHLLRASLETDPATPR